MPMLPPMLYSHTEITAEQRDEAMRSLEADLTKMRDMVLRLDLPATILPNVIDFYVTKLSHMAAVEEHKRMKARHKQMREKMAKQAEDGQHHHPGFPSAIRRIPGVPTMPMAPFDLFDEFDDED